MTPKPDANAKSQPSRLPQELMLKTLEKLAQDDSDEELARYVQGERARLKGCETQVFSAVQFEDSTQGRKPHSVWPRRFLLTACAAVSLLACLAFTSPDGLVVRSDGSVSGFFNILRERIQGQGFRQRQLAEAKAALEWELAAPERQAEREQELAARNRLLDQKIDDMYQRHPSLRPSPAEEYAEALREEADRIEAAELDRRLEEIRGRRIAELEAIVELLKKR